MIFNMIRGIRSYPLVPYKKFKVIESLGKSEKKLQPLDCPGKINLDNLIKIKTEAKPTTRNIKIATINVQSLKNKIDLVSEELNDNHIDIAILTESWLTDSIEDATWLKSCECNASPFKILVKNRKGKREEGIAIVYKNPIKVKLGNGGATRSFIYGTWSVNCNSKTFHIHGIVVEHNQLASL